MAHPGLRRIGLLLAGFIMGVLGLAIGLWFFLQAGRVDEARSTLAARVPLAREAIERVEFVEDTSIRFVLRQIALVHPSGDTILAAPRMAITLDALSLEGSGPIEFFDVEIERPHARLIRYPNDDWNFSDVLLSVGGQPVPREPGREFLFRDIRITEGDLVLALPVSAPAEGSGLFALELPRTELGGTPYEVYELRDVSADFPEVRIGGPIGWRVEVSSLAGRLAEPEIPIRQLAGWIEASGPTGVRFDLATLRFGDSELSGEGRFAFEPSGPEFDLRLRAEPLLLADLQPLLPHLPEESVARFDLSLTTLGGGRLAVRATELDLDLAGSRILGSIGAAFGGGGPFALLAADLELAPLELETLLRLGLVRELPALGEVRGRLTSAGAPPGFARIDLTATLVPREAPGSAPSVVLADGALSLSALDEPLRLEGVTVAVRPLHLELVRSFLPGASDLVRGQVEGSATLAGTLSDLQIEGGELTYRVDGSPPTRLVDLSGGVRTTPELSYRLRAVAQPLALATLMEIVPSLPFRSVTLTGPLELTGGADRLDFSADLTGASGGIRFAGSTDFTEPLRFEVAGTLDAFVAGMVLRPEIPIEGPLSGSFGARGTLEAFAFDIDLRQNEGRFAVHGTLDRAISPPRFTLAGEIEEFRIGALLGAPELFPDPMTGPIAVQGGGGAPYRFDVDLRGRIGRLALHGDYLPGPVPSYAVSGSLAGLDLSRIPLRTALPATELTGSVELRGRGLELENLEGMLAFDFTDSRIAGQRLDTAIGRVAARAGILEVDTLQLRLDQSQLRAAGSWGLTHPAAAPLRFDFSSPDLGVLARLFAPAGMLPLQIAGSASGAGELSGSIEYPEIRGSFAGRDLRYDQWSAQTLELTIDAARTPSFGWSGQLALAGDTLTLPGRERLQMLRLEATGNESSMVVGLFARRTLGSELALSGLLELEGLIPRGIALETFDLQLDGARWQLLNPARLRYTPREGVEVENLVLERIGPVPGLIELFGVIPPEGLASLTLRATAFDLADLHRISDTLPLIEGRLDLDALLTGPVEAPELSILAQLGDLRYEGVATERVNLQADYTAGRLTGAADAFALGQELVRADFQIPMELSLAGMAPAFTLLRADPLALVVRADSLPLNLIAAIVPGLADGVGLARAEIDVSGSLDAPLLQGWARLENGAMTIEPLSIRYSQIHADLLLEGNRITVSDLSARSGGTIQASGTIDFPPGATPRVDLATDFRDFRVMDDPRSARLTISGALALSGAFSAPVLTGQVQVSESTIQVPDLGAEQPGLELGYLNVPQLAPIPEEGVTLVPPMLGNLQVEGVQVSIAESVWLESNELRVQITGDLVLFRTGEELRVFGALQAVRGTYALEISSLVREFDVISGRVQFFGTGDLNPSLDILAGYRVRASTVGSGRDLTVLVHVTGTVLAPRLELTSDTPVPLSEADLISYLLFGQPSFELGGINATFAEQILVQEVFGGLIANQLERPILRANLCDWVRVRPGLTTSLRNFFGVSGLAGAVIECGREIAPDLFLTGQAAIGGLFAGDFTDGRIGLEWQIDNEWMWEASYGTVVRDPIFQLFPLNRTTQFSTDLRRSWDYGRPRERSLTELEAPIPDGR